MVHACVIRDMDHHFIIDPVTRSVTNAESKKTKLMQRDHNSECFTFEVNREVEGHDMSKCNVVRIHYNNTESGSLNTTKGLYEVKDLTINQNDATKVIFSWTITEEATQYAGPLSFIIEFKCVNSEGKTTYRWWSDINTSISISSGINNDDYIAENYVDILEQWKADVLALDDHVATLQECADTIVKIEKLEVSETNTTYIDDHGELTVATPDSGDYGYVLFGNNTITYTNIPGGEAYLIIAKCENGFVIVNGAGNAHYIATSGGPTPLTALNPGFTLTDNTPLTCSITTEGGLWPVYMLGDKMYRPYEVKDALGEIDTFIKFTHGFSKDKTKPASITYHFEPEYLIDVHSHDNKKTLDLFYYHPVENDSLIQPDVMGLNRLTFGGANIRMCYDGCVVQKIENVEEDGVKKLRLWFKYLTLDGIDSNPEIPDFIDIPVSDVANKEIEKDDGSGIVIGTNSGLGLDLGFNGLEEASHTHPNKDILDSITEDMLGGGIPVTHELLSEAADGDMCLYSPANIIELCDSGKRIYFDWEEFAKLTSERVIVHYQFAPTDNQGNIYIHADFFIDANQLEIIEELPSGKTTLQVGFQNGIIVHGKLITQNEGGYNEATLSSVDELPKYWDLFKFNEIAEVGITDTAIVFYAPYRLMVYRAGEWQRVETLLDIEGGSADGGVYVGSGDMPDDCNVQIDPDGDVAVIPTKTSELENDSGFITATDKLEITETTAELNPNTDYSFGEVAELTITFTEGDPTKRNEYMFSFTSGETATVLTLPSSVQWANELTVEANKRYEISVADNIGLWCAVDLAVSE